MADVERCVDLVLLARTARAELAAGKAVRIGDLTRLEGAADRAVRRLNLKPGAAAAPVQTLADYLARHGSADEVEG